MNRLIRTTALALLTAGGFACAPESPDADQPGMDREASTAVTGQRGLTAAERAEQATVTPTAPAVESAPLEDPGARVPLPVTRLMTVLDPTEGHAVTGELAFVATDAGLKIEGEFEGLPAGRHAFHIHQFGDCSGADGKTAGTHFNLRGSSENPPKDIDRITGDLGELVPDDDGYAKIEATVPGARIDGPYSVIGRAVIVHAKGNDPDSPPIGAAGARLACGVIGIARAAR